jgi:hypothetical protein
MKVTLERSERQSRPILCAVFSVGVNLTVSRMTPSPIQPWAILQILLLGGFYPRLSAYPSLCAYLWDVIMLAGSNRGSHMHMGGGMMGYKTSAHSPPPRMQLRARCSPREVFVYLFPGFP